MSTPKSKKLIQTVILLLVVAETALAFFTESKSEAFTVDDQENLSYLANSSANNLGKLFFETGDYSPGKFYMITHESETEQNRYMGQTAIVWEVNITTGTSRQLLVIEPYITETPRDILPENELHLLEESEFFSSGTIDRPLMGQGLSTIALLDMESLLVVTYREVREVMYNTAHGFYDLQILNLVDGSLTSILIIEYHQDFVEETWDCISTVQVLLDDFIPNPVTNQFVFSVYPSYAQCGEGFANQSYIVDYSTLPVQVEVIPFARYTKWSPDGSILAYAGVSYTKHRDYIATYATRPAALGSESSVVAQYPVSVGSYPSPVISWVDQHSILFQYTDNQTLNERNVWAIYDLDTDRVVLSEELPFGDIFFELDYLYDGQFPLIYENVGDLNLMRYTVGVGLVTVQTYPGGYIFDASKFRQYMFLGQPGAGDTTQVVTADGTLSPLDLGWLRSVILDQTIDYLVPGPPTQQVPNSPPLANAGMDQVVTLIESTTLVTLDGSGSSDSDGAIVAYRWYENDTLIAEGITPQVELGIGEHTVTLVVEDDDGATGNDEVVITVEAASGCVPSAPADPPTTTVAAGDTAGLIAAIDAANANNDPEHPGHHRLTWMNTTMTDLLGLNNP